jgi:putative peptide zinc metalloprotease protein
MVAVNAAPSSSHWYRVAHLKPRWRGHVRLHRHVYRGQVWHVVEDLAAGRQHRFDPAAHAVLRLFDGRHTLQQVWERLDAEASARSLTPTDALADAPTQDDIVGLLAQLNAADLVAFDITPDVAELFERGRKQTRQRWKSRLSNPLSLRFPLWDPDALLTRSMARWRSVPSVMRTALALTMAVVMLAAALLLPTHWAGLSAGFGDQLLAAQNLWLIAIVFPLLKLVHEMAHGWAVKLQGGEVHEMGLMLLLFYPVPYVDASAANAFADRRSRVLVGAAGMLAELGVAALALLLWSVLEPGMLRSVVYNVVVIASISTVIFNANPLLRYDGYYMLADAIAIPNLGARANAYWYYAISRYVFGAPPAQVPRASAAEKRWFIAYAPAALVYRLFVSLSIALFLSTQFFFVGVLMAAWSLFAVLVGPLCKGLRALHTAPHFVLRARRVRATLVVLAGAAAVALFLVQLPHHSSADGIVALPERALLRAQADGFVQRVVVPTDTPVVAGTEVLRLQAPALSAQLRVQRARAEEALARFDTAWARPAEQGRLREALQREEAVLHDLQAQAAQLSVRTAVPGRVMLDTAADLPGHFVRKGEVVGHVIGGDAPTVRVVVEQRLADQVRGNTRSVQLLLVQDLGTVYAGRVHRQLPRAESELPSAALGQAGGGRLVTDPRQTQGNKSMSSFFEFDIALQPLPRAMPNEQPKLFLGAHVHVRFEHPPEAIAWRAGRWMRVQFLSHFPQWA